MQLVSDNPYSIELDAISDPILRAAVAEYKVKERDLQLIIDSMGRHPQLHPGRQRDADRITDELLSDQRAIGRIVVSMSIWVNGVEL